MMLYTKICVYLVLLASSKGNLCTRCKLPDTISSKIAFEYALEKVPLRSSRNYFLLILAYEHGFLSSQRHGIVPVDEAKLFAFLDKKKSHLSRNPKSGTYGLGQFKPATWTGVGIKKTNCKACQMEAMRRYIGYRHKTSRGAVDHHLRKNWY